MNEIKAEYIKLYEAAEKAKENAYAPYSGFKVGAALKTKNGNIYIGCNVENVSFGATICAERTAACSAIAAGEKEFEAIAIAADRKATFPCGICRQFLCEFGDIDVIIEMEEGLKVFRLSELMPHSFSEF